MDVALSKNNNYGDSKRESASLATLTFRAQSHFLLTVSRSSFSSKIDRHARPGTLPPARKCVSVITALITLPSAESTGRRGSLPSRETKVLATCGRRKEGRKGQRCRSTKICERKGTVRVERQEGNEGVREGAKVFRDNCPGWKYIWSLSPCRSQRRERA